ncbi:SCO family protein [Advenella sp. RU8]|uniref:SCO family protein n=1 Tax=Advenella sp. RU8 TaxID=3399575 RepID=UPI003AAC8182
MIKKTLLCSILAAALLHSVPAAAQEPEVTKPSVIYKITGRLPDLKFSLNGAQNKTITEKDVKGKVVLLFFGYASCPDICPTTMAQLSALKSMLGNKANSIQILFLSVDPHRDTPEILQAYVDAFDNGAIGLTGTEKQIADIARRYRVAYQIEKPQPGSDPNNYEVMHARGIYVFDANGKVQFLASDSEEPEMLLAKIRDILPPSP